MTEQQLLAQLRQLTETINRTASMKGSREFDKAAIATLQQQLIKTKATLDAAFAEEDS